MLGDALGTGLGDTLGATLATALGDGDAAGNSNRPRTRNPSKLGVAVTGPTATLTSGIFARNRCGSGRARAARASARRAPVRSHTAGTPDFSHPWEKSTRRFFAPAPPALREKLARPAVWPRTGTLGELRAGGRRSTLPRRCGGPSRGGAGRDVARNASG